MTKQGLEIEITIDRGPRNRRGRKVVDSTVQPNRPRIPRTARLMALAIKFQGMVDVGAVSDYADLSRLGYVTRARLTQIMNLTMLAPEIQERLLNSTSKHELRESQLRHIIKQELWDDQIECWKHIRPNS